MPSRLTIGGLNRWNELGLVLPADAWPETPIFQTMS
jgi:hypothetical protein